MSLRFLFILLFACSSWVCAQSLQYDWHLTNKSLQASDISEFFTDFDNKGNTLVAGNYDGYIFTDKNLDSTYFTNEQYNYTGIHEDIFFTRYDSAGNCTLAKCIKGTGNDAINSARFDKYGNILLLGTFANPDLDPGPGVVNLPGTSGVYLTKYTSGGNFMYAKKLDYLPNLMTVDSLNNIIFIVNISDTIDADPGPGVDLIYATPTSLKTAMIKLDQDGNFIWSGSIASDNITITGISTGTDCSIYLAGKYISAVDFDFGPGVYSPTSVSNFNGFMAKYRPDKTLIRVGVLGNAYPQAVVKSRFYPGFGLVVQGLFDYDMDLDPSPGIVDITGGSSNGFIAAYDTAFNLLWGNSFDFEVQDFTLKADHSLVVTGTEWTNFDILPGPGYLQSPPNTRGMYIIEFDPGGLTNPHFRYLMDSFVSSGNAINWARLTVDNSGKYILSARISGNYICDLDPGPDTSYFSLPNHAALIFRLHDTVGTDWMQVIGMHRAITPNPNLTMCADMAGNSFVAAGTNLDFDIDRSARTTAPDNLATNAAMFTKLDVYGNKIWSRFFEGGSVDPSTMATDSLGNLYIAGSFSSLVDFDPSPMVKYTLTQATTSGFIAKYDSGGHFIFVKGFPGNTIHDICVGSNGNLYASGSIYNLSGDLDPGPGSQLPSSASNNSSFILSFDSSGALLWSRCFDRTGSSSFAPKHLAIDHNSNVFFLGKSSGGTVDMDPGPAVLNSPTGSGVTFHALIKLDQNGNYIWSAAYPQGVIFSFDKIHPDNSTGDVRVSGYFENTVDFDLSAGTAIYTSPNSSDAFLLTLTGSGAFSHVMILPSKGSAVICDFMVDASGNKTLVGYFTDSTDFQPGAQNVWKYMSGGTMGFIAKYNSIDSLIYFGPIGALTNSVQLGKLVELEGGILISGNCGNTNMDIDPNAGTVTLPEFGAIPGNLFIIRLANCSSAVNAAVTISSSSNMACPLAPPIFSATPVNGGDQTLYSWRVNGVQDYSGGPNFQPATLNVGDSIQCMIHSNAACAAYDSALSNIIVMTQPFMVPASLNVPDTLCNGETLILHASGGTNYLWSGPGFFVSHNADDIRGPLTFSDAGTYSVTVSDNTNCSVTLSANVSVLPLPYITYSSVNAICVNDTAVLSVAGGASYLWMPGGDTTASVHVAPALDTWYHITSTGTNGCSLSDSMHITVHSLPLVSAWASSDFVCRWSLDSLFASGANAYSWNPGGYSNDTIAVNVATPIQYMLTGTDTNGCSASDSVTVSPYASIMTLTAAEDTVCFMQQDTLFVSGASSIYFETGIGLSGIFTPLGSAPHSAYGIDMHGCVDTASTYIQVLSAPSIVVSGPSALCENVTDSLHVTGGGTYLWNPGTLTDSIISITLMTPATYSVTASFTNGCTDAASWFVNVLPLPSISVSGDSSICKGETTTLTAIGAATYLWAPGASSGSVKIATPSSTQTYSITGTGTNACQSVQTYLVTVHDPDVQISGDTVICQGESTVLGANGASVYTWLPGGASGVSQTVSPSTTTLYTLTGTDAFGCIDTDQAWVDVINIPTPTISFLSGNVSCNLSGAYTYAWTYNGTAMTCSAQLCAYIGDGLYEVTVTGTGGCTNSGTLQVINASINTNEKNEPSILVLPNPSSGSISIAGNGIHTGVDLQIVDVSGRILLEKNNYQGDPLFVDDLSTGIYLLKLQNDNLMLIKKIIVIR